MGLAPTGKRRLVTAQRPILYLYLYYVISIFYEIISKFWPIWSDGPRAAGYRRTQKGRGAGHRHGGEKAASGICRGASKSPYDFSSRLSSSRKRQSVPSAIILCGVPFSRIGWFRFGRPGCALNRPIWSPVKGSSARVSTIRSAIVVRQRFFGIPATDPTSSLFAERKRIGSTTAKAAGAF